MTTIDIISGFLGAGKTTLIKKLIKDSFQGQKVVLIENEFGEIGIDGGFMKDAGIQVTEMNSGCICCSLVGDFGVALRQVLETYAPDRIIIEPSGVGKLSDVAKAVGRVAENTDLTLGSAITVVNAKKCKMYMKNFGEFFDDQVQHAGTIILSRTGDMKEDKLEEAVSLLRAKNQDAVIITTPWEQITGDQILNAMKAHSLADELMAQAKAAAAAGEDEDDDEDECCHHHHHHHDGDEEDEHEHHHHHDHDEDEDEHEHHHHHHDHDEDEDGHEHHHHHHHHHHHDADEVFTSWGLETARKFTQAEIQTALDALDTGAYGQVLRAKGFVAGVDGAWIHFDYVPGEVDVRIGPADVTGRLCVIGSELKEPELKALFRL
ncbi:MAG: GTP-binding protein [Clostridiales bacterium]|nr:GTP-binding protein [Clostridiales bacterium]